MSTRSPKMTTREEFARFLAYDATTGIFTWIAKSAAATVIGSRAGSVVNYGHRVIVIGRRGYAASKLAWLFVHGEWPSCRLKAANGDVADDRIENVIPMKKIKGVFDHSIRDDRIAYQRAHYQADPAYYRASELKRKFGLNVEQYNAMHADQDGLCAICGCVETVTRNGKTVLLSVDHNHETGAVRDLLCRSCNQLIGNAREDETILQAAIDYLRKHNDVPAELAFSPYHTELMLH